MKIELKVFKLTIESERNEIEKLKKELIKVLTRAADVLARGFNPSMDLARISTLSEELKIRTIKLNALIDVQTEIEFLESEKKE